MLLSICRASGDRCTDDADCCSGVCGSDGLCPVMSECQTVGEPCTGYHECCSGLCADYGTGVNVCQFASGCRPIGEICHTSSDCCSAQCEPEQDTGVYRCVKPGGCMATGEICWLGQAANCCPQGPNGGQQLCLPTLIGITRCYPVNPTTCIPDGEECSFDDMCCGGYCVPNTNGVLVCGSTCIQLSGACTADSDCCDGFCSYGFCVQSPLDCIPLGASCNTDADCCSETCDPNTHVCSLNDVVM